MSVKRAGHVTTIGKYQLLVELARGGMGVVHLASMDGPGGFQKLVVVKELNARMAMRPELVEMFLEEARIAARLNHPNVVQTNEVGSDNGRHFLAMEFLEGPNLRNLLRAMQRHGGLPLPVHLHILLDALAGLHYAHELCDYSGAPLSIVHRDISPHNLIVTCDGVTKVVDFGLARASDTLRQTERGVLRGKIGYLAPEHLRGERVDRRADIFSVGVMLWEALAGRRMWEGLAELTIAQHLSEGDIPRLEEFAPHVAPELVAITKKALAPHRDDRFANAWALQSELESYLNATGQLASPRTVGPLVSEVFAAERERTRAIVDAQLQELRAHGTDTRIVVLEDTDDGAAPSSIMPASRHDFGAEAAPSSHHPAAHAGAITTPSPANVPSSRGAHRQRGNFPPSNPRHPSAPPPAAYLRQPHETSLESLSSLPPMHASVQPAPQPRPQMSMFVVSALFCLAGLSAVTGKLLADRYFAATEKAPTKLVVHTSPRHAAVYLDGRPIGTDAVAALDTRSQIEHILRVEAPGYTPTEHRVVLSGDLTLMVALAPTPPACAPTRPSGLGNRRYGQQSPEALDSPATRPSPPPAPSIETTQEP